MNFKSWKTLGIISTLLLIIISIFQVLDWINDKSDKINSTYKSDRYHLPININDKYTYKEFHSLKNEINNLLQKNNEPLVAKELADTISSITYDKFYDSFLNSIYQSNIIEINIESNSNKRLNNLSIDVDAEGICQIYTQEDKTIQKSFDHIISLEDLRPNNSLKIIIWTSNFIFRAEDIKINYDGGYSIPKKVEEYSGFSAFVARNKGIILIGILFSILWVVVYISDNYSKKSKSIASNIVIKKKKKKKKKKS